MLNFFSAVTVALVSFKVVLAGPVRERSLSDVSLFERDWDDSLFARGYEVDEYLVTRHGPPSTYWKPFFNADKSISTTFETLLHSIFRYVDASNLGYLSPEVYVALLEDLGSLPTQIIWLRNLDSSLPDEGIAQADTALTNWYLTFDAEMELVPRPVYASIMPMISEKGFMHLTALNTLGNPEALWRGLNYVLDEYGLLQNWGPIPRDVMPDFPDLETLIEGMAKKDAAAAKGIVMRR